MGGMKTFRYLDFKVYNDAKQYYKKIIIISEREKVIHLKIKLEEQLYLLY